MALKLKPITAGNTRRIDVTFYDADNQAVDLTGAVIALTATDGTTNVITLNNTDEAAQFTLLGDGAVRINLSSANTTLTAGTYNFGVQATLTDGTVLEETGSFKVNTQYVT